jgi:uncharacterized protein (DUF1330 family)
MHFSRSNRSERAPLSVVLGGLPIGFSVLGFALTLCAACAHEAKREPPDPGNVVYYIGAYDIDNPELFKEYPVRVAALLHKYGGVVLASDTSAYVLEGQARRLNAIIRFPSKEAALGLYNDPAYQEAKRIRQSSTSNGTMVLVHQFH